MHVTYINYQTAIEPRLPLTFTVSPASLHVAVWLDWPDCFSISHIACQPASQPAYMVEYSRLLCVVTDLMRLELWKLPC